VVNRDPNEPSRSLAPTTATDRADIIARTRAAELDIIHLTYLD
jgi:hypothetical protein